MQTLSIDLETFSSQPLQRTGVYRYVESPDFEILLFAYSVDGGPVQQIDLASGEKIQTGFSRCRFPLFPSESLYSRLENPHMD